MDITVTLQSGARVVWTRHTMKGVHCTLQDAVVFLAGWLDILTRALLFVRDDFLEPA